MTIDTQIIETARHIELAAVVRERSLKLVGRPPELCGPCPACGGKDRFSVNLKKQVFNCRGCGAKGGGSIDLVMFLDGCDFGDAVEALAGRVDARRRPTKPVASHEAGVGDKQARPSKSEGNRALAQWLWKGRRRVTEDCPPGLYLRGARGYPGAIPATLGYLPANGKHPPAMIAAFGFCEELEPGVLDPPADVTGVHITRLTPEGHKAPVDPVKIMLGPSMGLPIVLAPAGDLLAINITEGIEDGLSVLSDYKAGIWVAGAAGNMPKIVTALPSYIECVRIFAHRDEAGLRNAQQAARIAVLRRIDVKIHLFG